MRSSPDWFERVATDPSLRQEIAAARSCCVPLSLFRGAEQVTTYEHDEAGRVVRAVCRVWSLDDRMALLALQAYEAGLCPGCHRALSETTKPENEDRYDADRPLLCHCCVARRQAGAQYEKHPYAEALLIPITLRDA